MPEWLIVIGMIFMYVLGAMDATAICREKKDPLWRGYLDIRTFRILRRRS